MAKVTKEDALRYHAEGKPGKIEVIPTKPYSTQADLSLAYSPGVAEPCLEIQKNPLDAYKYTAKGNLVAVISNGTAVLGLGNIGAMAGKPVMEGKGLLFKIFAGIDVFDIEVDEKDPQKFIETVKAIAPTFGGINLEDIKAPECFEIETRLKNELDIPVMHDDQHGTAIISGAGLINALEVAGKKIEDVKIVVNGAGAASISCTKLYVMLGARKENIIMCDSKGVISTQRTDLNEQKREFATDRPVKTLEEAVAGADVFLGLSVADVLTKEMVRSMNANPIVFALANPNPEISYADAMESREDIIFATGRSDYPNQINNVLGFPYIFRGALDTSARAINEEMKLAAVKAIAQLAKEPVPDVVNAAYKLKRTTFGRDYILPKALDPRLLTRVSCAVAKAAMDSGVARREITDWDEYANHLREMMGYDNKLLRSFTDMAKANPKRVVFAEANHINMLKAAAEAKAEGICQPILLGNWDYLHKLAGEENISLEGIEIINMRSDSETDRRHRYASILAIALMFLASCDFLFSPPDGTGDGSLQTGAATGIEAFRNHEDVIATAINDEVNYFEVNGNKPVFTDTEKTSEYTGTHLSELDALKRVGAAWGSYNATELPTDDREPSLDTEPTGWHQNRYDGQWLMNRCHLIGYQISGLNDEPRNLMSGTRSFNVGDGMVKWENLVAN